MNSGGLQISKLLTRKIPRIFMYHNFSESAQAGYVSAEQFDWQLRQIKNNFNVLTFIELSKLVFEKKEIPDNTIVLTIDDGYKNFYETAFPLLKKYNIKATFFVTSGFINQDLWLWPDQLKWLLNNKKNTLSKISLLKKDFIFSGDEIEDWQQINDFCLSINEELKYQVINELSVLLEKKLPNRAPDKFASCSWKQLQEMQEWGIEIGGHSVTHPSLGQVSLEQAKYEIQMSLIDINQQLGSMHRTFCYPNGQPDDYNNDIKVLVKKAGYINAVTAFNDSLNITLPFSWRRFDGGNDKKGYLKALYGVEMLGNQFRKTMKCLY